MLGAWQCQWLSTISIGPLTTSCTKRIGQKTNWCSMYMCLELWLPDAQLNSLWTDAMAWRMSAGLDNRLLYTLRWGLKVLWGLLWLFISVWYMKSSKKWGSWTVSPLRNYLWQAEHNNRVREIRVEVYEQFNSIGKFMTLPQCNFSGISNHTWSNPDDNLMH